MNRFLIFALGLLFMTGKPVHGEKLVFYQHWTAQAEFAGYYMAQEKGFFQEAGLEVELKHPSTSISVFTKLNSGEADVIGTSLLTAMTLVSDGTPLINILQLTQTNARVIVTQPEITSLEQLANKRFAVWKNGYNDAVRCIMNDLKIPVEWISFSTGTSIFLSHAVDAIISMYFNEFFLLTHSGLDLTDKNFFFLSELGYNIPEDGLYCKPSIYQEKRAAIEKFSKACQKGWLYAAEHPDETLEVVIKYMQKDNIPVSPVHQRWMLEKMLELVKDKNTKETHFRLTRESLALSNEILLRNSFITEPVIYEQFVSQDQIDAGNNSTQRP